MRRSNVYTILFNKMLIILLAAMMVFTPFYSLQRMYILITIFILWFITTLVIDRRWYWKKNVLFSILILIIMIAMDAVLSDITRDSTYLNQCITHKIFIYLWYFIFLFYCNHCDLLKSIIPLIMLLILISAIFTLFGNIANPEASRLLAGTGSYYSATREKYRQLYIGGYDLIYSLVFVLMPLLLIVRNNLKKSYIALISLIIFIVTVVVCSYFIGILLTATFILCVFIKPDKIGRYFMIMLIILLGVILAKNSILEFLVNIGNSIGSDILVKRANEMITMSYVSDYGEGNRIAIYHNAFLNYLDHPFLGTLQGTLENHRRSGHSALLVYLENYGLLSLIYYGFLFKIFKTTKKCYKNIMIHNSYKIYFILLLIFMFVDVFDTAYALGCVAFFVAPSMLIMIDKELGK